eukprot:TRINITY_DN19157_c0_g1_i1.p1 TRINITY_DN19157_c0_g1~~TRINITY_DN19157_c0_g1_i1.p1  ORF type:complete len:893 (+),score=159.24 TRINITY_DN19157_c0_g1_i1:57-2735(+)
MPAGKMTFEQQLEKAAEQAQEAEEGGPSPPQRPPPKRTEGLGARAALNALRALGPWNRGSSQAKEPAAQEAPTTSQSQPNLPTVSAKPPATPAPGRGASRRPTMTRGRSAGSVPATPRDEAGAAGNNTPRQPSAREQSPGLPSVRPSTPTQPAAPGSARGTPASVRVSYQMTPRELEAPNPADGPTDSPVPRRPRSKAPAAEVVSQSAPAAPSSHGAASENALSSTGNCREMMEVQGNAQKLLEAVFEITITEEAAVSILDSYPELVWLANCLRRCPLPPGWTAMEVGTGRFKYVDMGTGATADVSPLMQRFADLGRLMLHWRQNPSAEAEVAAALGNKRDQDNEDAIRARKVWKGPHMDPKTGAEFWHCPATGRSTWGDPGMAAEFLARISDRLQKALPTSGKEGEASDANAKPSESCEDSQKSAAEAKDPPATPLADRQAEVRDMMKEFVSAAKPPPAGRPKRPNTGRSRPASPAPPHAPRGQPGSSASEPTLSQVGEDVSQDIRARRRPVSTSREREASEEPMGRVVPGHNLTGEFSGDITPRREFRRRRLDSSERLDPLAAAECADRPSSSRGPAEPEPASDRPEPGSAQALLAPAFEPGTAVVSDRPDFPPTDRRPGTGAGAPRPGTGARPGTGKKEKASRPPSRSGATMGEDGRPTTRRGGKGEPEVMTLGGTFGKNPMASSFNGTGGFGLSNTAMERMCQGAIAAAFNQAFGETSPGESAEMDEDVIQDDDDDVDHDAEMAAIAAAARGDEEKRELDQDHGDEQDEGEGGEERAVDLSMSLMSICGPRSPSPKKVRAPLSPHAESPSIILLEGEEPVWTSHKPLPKPKTPPRSARSEKKERPVLLGVPEPLSARGAARCDANGAPLSARYHRPRPGNRRGSAGGA